MQTQDTTILSPDEIAAITAKLQSKMDQIASMVDRTATPIVVYDGSRWIGKQAGQNDADLSDLVAREYIEPMVKERAKAERVARQRTMILACRAAMTDDEFVTWCLETLPLIACPR